jgi:hypothetical protein
MSGHLIIHYLDVFRHDNAFTWAWYTWIGNVSAGVIIGSVMSLFYPPLRRAVKTYIEGHIKSIHDKLDGHHEELLRQGERHHVAAMKQAQKHHEEHLAAIAAAKPTPRKKPV